MDRQILNITLPILISKQLIQQTIYSNKIVNNIYGKEALFSLPCQKKKSFVGKNLELHIDEYLELKKIFDACEGKKNLLQIKQNYETSIILNEDIVNKKEDIYINAIHNIYPGSSKYTYNNTVIQTEFDYRLNRIKYNDNFDYGGIINFQCEYSTKVRFLEDQLNYEETEYGSIVIKSLIFIEVLCE